MNNRILLLEDDHELGQTLKDLLESEGYDVELVTDGNMAVDASYEDNFDLYVFDINVPEINGIELLESLRNADDKTPAIFISALVDLNSISKGFEVGADDYIKKPFFPEELLIRVKAKFSQHEKSIQYGDLVYETQSKTLRKNDKVVSMGEVQERLFDIFIQNIGQVLDKTVLLECLEHPSDSALRVALTKLKQTTGLKIKNIRAIGYTLEAC